MLGIHHLEAANTIHDLWITRSMHFEKLKGFSNRYSIRLTIQWRLEIEIEWLNEEKTIGEICVLDLTKHYGD